MGKKIPRKIAIHLLLLFIMSEFTASSGPSSSMKFTFGVIGDTQYVDAEDGGDFSGGWWENEIEVTCDV